MIDIIDDINPYLALLGIYWATDMNRLINLKKQKMIFERKSLRVVVPLDPAKGVCYTKPVHNDERNKESDCIYKIIARDQDWVIPIVDGRILCEQESSYTSNSNKEVE